MTVQELQQLVTSLYMFLKFHPSISPHDMREALTILEKRYDAIAARDAANSDATQYGLPQI